MPAPVAGTSWVTSDLEVPTHHDGAFWRQMEDGRLVRGIAGKPHEELLAPRAPGARPLVAQPKYRHEVAGLVGIEIQLGCLATLNATMQTGSTSSATVALKEDTELTGTTSGPITVTQDATSSWSS